MNRLVNPFTPGAGHYPPHLAGRDQAIDRCKRLFEQTTILRNIILTGLRGVGKTVLLAKLKDIASAMGWLWCGTDMSESASITEQSLCLRILTDLSVVTSHIPMKDIREFKGFSSSDKKIMLGYETLNRIFETTPGLSSDKLKKVFEIAHFHLVRDSRFRGIIFAYDEVQTMDDHAKDKQYPLSLLLDVFQSIQKKDTPFMLLLTGLPTLLPKLVATRTYSERMFETIFLDRLSEGASKDAIEKPISRSQGSIRISEDAVKKIINRSGGYPYFIQFIARETYEIFIRQAEKGQKVIAHMDEIVRKLDADFFLGRWSQLTDRQMDLLRIIASLNAAGNEFTVQEIVEQSKKKGVLEKSFTGSHVTQLLNVLQNKGIVYKNKHGKYLFAVPLFDEFVRRQIAS